MRNFCASLIFLVQSCSAMEIYVVDGPPVIMDFDLNGGPTIIQNFVPPTLQIKQPKSLKNLCLPVVAKVMQKKFDDGKLTMSEIENLCANLATRSMNWRQALFCKS